MRFQSHPSSHIDAISIAPKPYVRDAISIAPKLYMQSQSHLSPTYHRQGSTHTDTNIGELYLCSYKNVIPIMPDEIKEGGGVNAGNLPTNCGSCYYKIWMISVSGQDSDKLAEKFVKKGPMKIQDKADRPLEMMQRMNLGGVDGV